MTETQSIDTKVPAPQSITAIPPQQLIEFSASLDRLTQRLRAGFAASERGYQWRMEQLKALKRMLVENDALLCEAMWTDLRKSRFECVATEQGVVLSEIEDALKNLRRWMKPKRVSTPLYNLPGRCEIRHDPLGLALIIGAWNYPINLLLAPLVGAIAGGNAVILKPSELANATAKLIVQLVPKYMDASLIAVVEGGPEETGALLDKNFDTIFFTGSGPVGKIVMSKAAVHLTPVTLELGGKSPAIVLHDADIKVVAKRIAWGKFMNAGQTCVAPDYILIEPSVKAAFVSELKAALLSFYGTEPKKSPDYCRIVNAKNFDRLMALLPGSEILHGGVSDRSELYIEPTILASTLAAPIMQGEIFGPLLPIVEIANVDDAIKIINERPKPLSLYLFSGDRAATEKVLEQTSAGGVCINDVVMHMPVAGLPFGGVGPSGMGHYHGDYSFNTFTHAKGVLKKATWIDIPLRYAPYLPWKINWLRRLF
jgi:aldehyde dehydrogenase (NAD+)